MYIVCLVNPLVWPTYLCGRYTFRTQTYRRLTTQKDTSKPCQTPAVLLRHVMDALCQPKLPSVILPISAFFQYVYTKAGKSTQLAAERNSLTSSHCIPAQEDAFIECKNALDKQVNLGHHDVSRRLSVYTVASDPLWSGVIKQGLRKTYLRHMETKGTNLSASFRDTFVVLIFDGTPSKKEAYAIMETVERMHRLLATADGFDLDTDHRNLIFLFDPFAVVQEFS